ncbi:minor tail protein [Mycobacterium phage PainterBoy]|nr:minor tail protein [Mycobacterium phage PainterBoy]
MTDYPKDPNHAIGSDGAFEIGGGDWSFGQDYTENAIRALFTMPAITMDNALDLLEEHLLKVPLEALQGFKDLLPDVIDGAFDTVAGAVRAIMNALAAPLKFLLEADWQEWINNTWSGFQAAVNQIIDILRGLIVTPINQAVQDIKDWWNAQKNKTQLLRSDGKMDAGNLVGQVAKGAVEGLEDLASDVVDGFKGVFDGWFGGSHGSGSPAEIKQTIEAIKSAVVGGYTIHTFTSSDPAWVLPANTSIATGIVIGGGGRGGTGNTGDGAITGGVGGSSGGYISQDLDLTGLTPGESTFAVTVGAGATTQATDGQRSKIVASTGTLLESIPNVNGISDLRGFIGTTSAPARGGKGGDANSGTNTVTQGQPGDNSNATGGAGGQSTASPGNGGNGGAGGPGDVASPVKFGGAGGGGGGSRVNVSGLQQSVGGNGGAGGYPGGGSGGGGAVAGPSTSSRTPGSPGTAPPGLVVILTK